MLQCSAQDKTILEDAYNANPKPDKAARLNIVNRVTLNEKEVQVSLGRSNSNGSRWLFFFGYLTWPYSRSGF